MSSSSSAFSDLDLDKLLSTQDIFNSQDDNSSNKVNPHRNADVQQLIRHWRNEKVAPDILPYAGETISNLEIRLTEQNNRLLDSNQGKWSAQQLSWYQLDYDRIRYIINSYKRIRIFKIQKWYLYLQQTPSIKKYLSPNELLYLDAYSNLRLQHLETSVLSRLYERDRTLGSIADDSTSTNENNAENHLRDGPNLHKHILVRAIQPFIIATDRNNKLIIRLYTEEDEGTNDTIMDKGNMQILPYLLIRTYLRDGLMEAI